MSTDQSLVAGGYSYNLFPGIAFLAVCERGEPGGIAIVARSGAGVFSLFRRRQRGAHRAANANDDLAAGGPAFAKCHFVGATIPE